MFMFAPIDRFLNNTTMYRVVLYYLLALWFVAIMLSIFGIISYHPLAIIGSGLFITAVSWLVNVIFAKVFETPANIESIYITAFILVFLITPPKALVDIRYLELATLASVIGMASKYILALYRKHIFNPVAIAVAIPALVLGNSATWWVGTAWMTPFVLLGGILVVRKIQREDMITFFFVAALVVMILVGLTKGSDPLIILKKTFLDTPILFFAFAMLTEPLTTPPTKPLQIVYGVLVGLLFSPSIHIGSIYSTPELALLVGNIFAYIVSPKKKLMLTLKEKREVGRDTYDFIFDPDQKMDFTPGQYVEWTLAHKHPDMRGNRRYFTIASSPTEREIHMGVKFYPSSSTYKQALLEMNRGDKLLAGQLAGDFTLPKDPRQKLVFIAGGIGITPFRSMMKYLIDTHEKRDIIIFYANRTKEDIAYKEIFDEAEKKLNIKTIYVLSDKDSVPANWYGRVGYIDKQMIMEEAPDYKDRTFYVSGPHSMVTVCQKTLQELGLPSSQTKCDFFPGFA